MGKKKFIEKKNSATFQLFARDSSSCSPAIAPPDSVDDDRVFVRVDNNTHYSGPGLFAEEGDDGNGYDAGGEELDNNSVFADAQEGSDEEEAPSFLARGRSGEAPLPDHVRREILELGLPDDGYNYLAHLREIRKSGAGSNYYQNSKAKLESLPLDVRAYDASRLQVKMEATDPASITVYDVAAKTVSAKLDKVVDPEVVRLLDDSDLSRFGLDVEDLEEDFVLRANYVEGLEEDKGSTSKNCSKDLISFPQNAEFRNDSTNSPIKRDSELEVADKLRHRRPLDEQFDLLMLYEYGDDSDSNSDSDGDFHVQTNREEVLKEFPQDELEYIAPADLLRQEQAAIDPLLAESTAAVLLKCTEYAQMYDQEDENKEDLVPYEESSEESEIWDCETIVSTYSNLDNHPGRIEAPGKPRMKRQVPDLASAVFGEKKTVIALRGKEMLPVDFLPRSRKTPAEKERKPAAVGCDQLKRKPDESKEEKKERKAAVKEARKEARLAKKQLKGLYKCESQLAQKVAAVSGPSSIRFT
ncbi:low temperature viability protein [Wolffia australiana]